MYLNVSHPCIPRVNELKHIFPCNITRKKSITWVGFFKCVYLIGYFQLWFCLHYVCCSVYILHGKDSTAAYIWLKLNWGQHKTWFQNNRLRSRPTETFIRARERGIVWDSLSYGSRKKIFFPESHTWGTDDTEDRERRGMVGKGCNI